MKALSSLLLKTRLNAFVAILKMAAALTARL